MGRPKHNDGRRLHVRMIAMLFTKADGAVVTKKQAAHNFQNVEKWYFGTTIPSKRGQASKYGSLRPYSSESGPIRGSVSESECRLTGH